jgi:hypothetical protein
VEHPLRTFGPGVKRESKSNKVRRAKAEPRGAVSLFPQASLAHHLSEQVRVKATLSLSSPTRFLRRASGAFSEFGFAFLERLRQGPSGDSVASTGPPHGAPGILEKSRDV